MTTSVKSKKNSVTSNNERISGDSLAKKGCPYLATLFHSHFFDKNTSNRYTYDISFILFFSMNINTPSHLSHLPKRLVHFPREEQEIFGDGFAGIEPSSLTFPGKQSADEQLHLMGELR